MEESVEIIFLFRVMLTKLHLKHKQLQYYPVLDRLMTQQQWNQYARAKQTEMALDRQSQIQSELDAKYAQEAKIQAGKDRLEEIANVKRERLSQKHGTPTIDNTIYDMVVNLLLGTSVVKSPQDDK